MKLSTWIALASLAYASCSSAAEQFTLIGDIPAVCPITIKIPNEQMPIGFRITPQEAVKNASERSWVKCNSKLQQQVYSDSDNYYIIKAVFGPMNEESEAVIVNGKSGMVSISNRRDVHNYIPPQGYVPDAETAITIAVAVWIPIYGEAQIAQEKPYTAVLLNGIWTVQGSLPKEMLGGVAIAEISKIDGRVIRVSHGR